MSLKSVMEALFRGDPLRQALDQQRSLASKMREYALRDKLAFARAMERITGEALTIGKHLESGKSVDVRIPLPLCHHLIQGRSGSGKTYFVESSLITPVLQSFPNVGVIVVDGKGELFARVQMILAALFTSASTVEREKLLERVVIVDPFHPQVIPPLNLCTAAGYPPEILADDILGALRRLFTEVTVRMEVLLRNLLVAIIEAGADGPSLSLLEARELLGNEPFRERVLLRVKNAEARSYFSQEFHRESRATIDAIRGRLSYLMVSEQIRLSLGAGGCIDFRNAIDQGRIVLINLGKTLLATDTARYVVGTLLLSALVRAIFARPMNSGPYLLAFMDEFQNFVELDMFASLYTEARAYRCFVTAICQQLGAQIAPPSLRDIIVNNVRYATLFSSNEADARLLGRMMFKPSGCRPKPPHALAGDRTPQFYSEAEEIEMLIRGAASLGPRRCYFWDKESSFGAQLIVSKHAPEPHRLAGLSEENFARALKDFESLCVRAGSSRQEMMNVIEARRNGWGMHNISQVAQSCLPLLSRKALLQKLERRLAPGANNDCRTEGDMDQDTTTPVSAKKITEQ